ncbi:MAG: AAA family ATPase [Alphaproteobacteria bacterium]|nr:AAA family ATPase [Alphaproteobacteria bacterium]
MAYVNNAARFPIGISDFQKLILGNYNIADKTLFIKEIIDDSADVILITRPRRFGKTLNLSMLNYFLQNDASVGHNLFSNLEVSKHTDFCSQHQNQYPVIFISFKDIKGENYQNSYDDIVALIGELYSDHRHLLEGNLLADDEKNSFLAIINETASRSKIENSLKLLSEFLTRKFGKMPFILIDEYDTPIQSGYLEGYYDDIIGLMRGIFSKSLKDNKYLTKSVLTGITRISQESLFSGLNNIEVYSLLEETYGQYFGFTEQEVIKLKDEAGLQSSSTQDIKNWYNGYRIGKHTIYNPWSIIHCLKNNGALKPYWINTSSNNLVKILLTDASYSVKKDFERLLQGEVIEKPIYTNLVFPELKTAEEALWSLLLYAGYLNVLKIEMRDFDTIGKVCIPNQEIMYTYNGIVAGWFRKNNSLDSYKNFITSLKEGDMDEFKRLTEEMLGIGSYFDFNKNTSESVFHSFMLGLTVGLKDDFIIQSNIESGKGRSDVAFIPKTNKNRGILLEFKTAEKEDLLRSKAKEALEQIKNKEYYATFKAHEVTKLLAIGLAFCGKRLELEREEIIL